MMPGFLTAVYYYPEVDLAVAVQINSDHGPAREKLTAFVDEIAGTIASLE